MDNSVIGTIVVCLGLIMDMIGFINLFSKYENHEIRTKYARLVVVGFFFQLLGVIFQQV